MSGSYALVPQQYFDDNGNPLSSGQIFTYAAGTSTPLATYSDFDLTTPNTNPVDLNAGGRPDSGAIYLNADTLYDLTIFDSGGTQVTQMLSIGNSSGGGSTSSWPGEAEDIASSSLTDLGTLGSYNANITGTTTINSFGSSATLTNPVYLAKFEGAVTITASASILIKSGVAVLGDSLITAANDTAWLEYLGSGTWKIFGYSRGDASITASSATATTLTVTTTANLP